MQWYEVLDTIENTGSLNEKIALLRQHRSRDLEFVLRSALDYRVLYYMNKIPDCCGSWGDLDSLLATFDIVLDLCRKEGRLQSTKQFVAEWLANQPPELSKWYKRVLLKDLRCGVGVDLCVKAGYDIPSFEVQLATDAKKCKRLESIVAGGVMVSPKLDGYRCLAVGVDGQFTLHTRNGNVYENFPAIKAELELLFPDGEYVFDGEIMSGSFNDMQRSAFASKRGTTVGDVKYHVFDCIPHNEWVSEKFTTKYFDRFAALKAAFLDVKTSLIEIVPHNMAESVSQVKGFQHDFESIGYEGAMVNPNIPYYMGRKTNCLLKFKSMLTWDCKVVGLVEGRGKLVGTLGAMEVVQENGRVCEVGTGFTEEERDFIWNHRDEVVGRVVEVKYQELTPDGFMRFPVFMRYRTDK
jgi:DNA ligase 1